jgi:hypothetical protein
MFDIPRHAIPFPVWVRHHGAPQGIGPMVVEGGEMSEGIAGIHFRQLVVEVAARGGPEDQVRTRRTANISTAVSRIQYHRESTDNTFKKLPTILEERN